MRSIGDQVRLAATTLAATAAAGQLSVAQAQQTPSMTKAEASRFLGHATFGPSMETIEALRASTPQAWLQDQFNKPQQQTYLAYINTISTPTQTHFQHKFWKQVATAPDQLRQRVAFALSQIFVVSFQDAGLGSRPRCVADYYDTLANNAFGNFRTLLEKVALHPAMGIYLSHLRNQKESLDGSRHPDENFAREIMQLFTIGLYQLDDDGTPLNGTLTETYQHDDVAGLAKVFTGWSFGGPDKTNRRFIGSDRDPNWEVMPMQNYPNYHSSSEKKFLGVTISGATSGEAALAIALDTLFNHRNVGPFIGKQLIQRLVTSNPSADYVERVALAFNDNGLGERGDMKAVIKAVLLDPEATSTPTVTHKIREPILRLANWVRAFKAGLDKGTFMIVNLDDPIHGLGQAPMRSPSVFNFYRPGYAPSNTAIAAQGQVAPEMQIVGEPTVTGYLNFMQNVVAYGAGTGFDVQSAYIPELQDCLQPAVLTERLNILLLNGNMSDWLRSTIETAINDIPVPTPTADNADLVLRRKMGRIRSALYLALASAEYIVQK